MKIQNFISYLINPFENMAYKETSLSENPNGGGILVVGTDTASATLIHTAQAGENEATYDVITLEGHNSSDVDQVLYVEVGGNTADKLIKQTLPAKSGRQLVLSREYLRNSQTIKAFADTANKIVLSGTVEVNTSDS